LHQIAVAEGAGATVAAVSRFNPLVITFWPLQYGGLRTYYNGGISNADEGEKTVRQLLRHILPAPLRPCSSTPGFGDFKKSYDSCLHLLKRLIAGSKWFASYG
jgi:hypothetical protein